jgi:hypothetical protein
MAATSTVGSSVMSPYYSGADFQRSLSGRHYNTSEGEILYNFQEHRNVKVEISSLADSPISTVAIASLVFATTLFVAGVGSIAVFVISNIWILGLPYALCMTIAGIFLLASNIIAVRQA